MSIAYVSDMILNIELVLSSSQLTVFMKYNASKNVNSIFMNYVNALLNYLCVAKVLLSCADTLGFVYNRERGSTREYVIMRQDAQSAYFSVCAQTVNNGFSLLRKAIVLLHNTSAHHL